MKVQLTALMLFRMAVLTGVCAFFVFAFSLQITVSPWKR